MAHRYLRSGCKAESPVNAVMLALFAYTYDVEKEGFAEILRMRYVPQDTKRLGSFT